MGKDPKKGQQQHRASQKPSLARRVPKQKGNWNTRKMQLSPVKTPLEQGHSPHQLLGWPMDFTVEVTIRNLTSESKRFLPYAETLGDEACSKALLKAGRLSYRTSMVITTTLHHTLG